MLNENHGPEKKMMKRLMKIVSQRYTCYDELASNCTPTVGMFPERTTRRLKLTSTFLSSGGMWGIGCLSTGKAWYEETRRSVRSLLC